MEVTKYMENINQLINERIKSIRRNNYVDSGNGLIQEIDEDINFDDICSMEKRNENLVVRFKGIYENRLTATFRNFTVICLPQDFNRDGNIKNGLSRKYEAAIIKIDHEKKEVYVSCIKGFEKIQAERSSFAKQLDNEIEQKIKKKERVIYPAKVIKILTKKNGNDYFTFAILSILDSKVTGFIYARDFAQCWIRDLRNVCSIGDWLDVEIVSRRKNDHAPYYWNCSRLNITESPWTKENIDDRFKRGDMLVVKCETLDKKSRWWWGSCDEVKGIELFCDFRKGVNIYPGGKYKCVIKQVSYKDKMFKVVPLEEFRILKDY